MIGRITVKPLDPAEPGTTPYIIHTADPFEVEVDWSIEGPTASYLGGRWNLRLYISPADGVAQTTGLLQQKYVPLSNTASLPLPRKYMHKFNIGANVVKEGVYHMTVVLTYDNGGPQLEMAAFAEIPFIEFYVA